MGTTKRYHRPKAKRKRPGSRARMRTTSRHGRSIYLALNKTHDAGAVQSLAAAAQKIQKKSGANRIAIPVADVAVIGEIVEDLLDIAVYRSREGEPTIPHEVVVAIHEGTHPVRAWRVHKGLTLKQLATVGKLTVGYLSEIETGKKPGSIAAYRALAGALGTEIDLLVSNDE